MNLVDYNEKNIKILSEDTQWMLVAEDTDNVTASISQAFLEDKEIPCVILNQMDHSFNMMFGKNGIIKIYVPLDNAREAYELLNTNFITTDSDIENDNL